MTSRLLYPAHVHRFPKNVAAANDAQHASHADQFAQTVALAHHHDLRNEDASHAIQADARIQPSTSAHTHARSESRAHVDATSITVASTHMHAHAVGLPHDHATIGHHAHDLRDASVLMIADGESGKDSAVITSKFASDLAWHPPPTQQLDVSVHRGYPPKSRTHHCGALSHKPLLRPPRG